MLSDVEGEKLLTIKELSELIQVSPKTIYSWTHLGYAHHIKSKLTR